MPRQLVDHVRGRLVAPRRESERTPVHPPVPEERAAYRILNFALRAGAVMLSSGAGTVEVETTILALAQACGMRECEVDVTFTSMTASYIRGDDVAPVTIVRVVRHRTVDYSRLAGVYQLRSDLVDGRISVEVAFARLDSITAAASPRRRSVIVGWAAMAAAFTVLLGGDVIVAAVAFVSTAAVYIANRRLARLGIPDFFLAAFGAAVATGFAVVLVALHVSTPTSLVVAGGIMVLLPGYALVASVQDALTGFPISASARGLEVVLAAAGIVTGVALTLYIAVLSGVHISVHVHAPQQGPLVKLPLQVIAAGVAAAVYGLATFVPRHRLPAAGVAGASGWIAFLLLRHAGASLIFATAMAAILVGLVGNGLARLHRTHPFLYTVPAVMPLLPGLTIYQGMLDLFYGHNGDGTPALLRALGIGLAIAGGVILGSIMIRPLRRPRRRHAPVSG